jgi:very-short-patch-repair endonuclease
MSRKLTHEEILNRLEKLNGNRYTYVLGDIKGVHDKIKIICSVHGESTMILWDLLCGSICKKCAISNGKNIQKIGTNKFTQKSIEKFGPDAFDYSYVDYVNNRTKVSLKCKKHNLTFTQVPHQHLSGNISCPKCTKIISVGESVIREILINRNIKFVEQHSFKDCKNKHLLKFDFYLPEHNTIIEYDGIQHFRQGWNSEREFERTKSNDIIKTKYCMDNNIQLIRIPYTDFTNIEKILLTKL